MDARGFWKFGKVGRDGSYCWWAKPVLSPVINTGDILVISGRVKVARPRPHYGFDFVNLYDTGE